jgi:hypothetical protein
MESVISAAVLQCPPMKKAPVIRHCSICGEPGHDKRNCVAALYATEEEEDDYVVEDEELAAEPELVGVTFEGVEYWRYADGGLDNAVYDDEYDEVGQWQNGAILFDERGMRLHHFSKQH